MSHPNKGKFTQLVYALYDVMLLSGFVFGTTYFLVGLDVTFLQVLGVVILIDTFKYYVRKY